MKVKAKCARALINLKEKESKRENSNELCKTKLYYATRRQRVCGQNKKRCMPPCSAHTRSQAYDAAVHSPMAMPVLDGVKHITLSI